MKLSEEQIQELYTFTRKRLVEHYDLQTELVDHLANGIEQQWQENETILFKDALKNEFKKFGHFGFKGIIKKRKKAISKRYWKHIFRFYKEYFRLPKILLVVGLSVLLYMCLQLISPTYKMMGLTLLFFGVGIYFMFYSKKKRGIYTDKIVTNKKRWMLEEKIYNLGEWSQMVIFPGHVFNMFFSSSYELSNSFLEYVICVFSVCYLTLSYIMVFVIPQKAEELLSETYPEYRMV